MSNEVCDVPGCLHWSGNKMYCAKHAHLSDKHWSKVLGIGRLATAVELENAYQARLDELNKAREEAIEDLAG